MRIRGECTRASHPAATAVAGPAATAGLQRVATGSLREVTFGAAEAIGPMLASAIEMLRDFQGRVAVVTGAAGGIGRALALGFAAEGMRVVAADVDEAGAADTAASIGDAARAFGVDVSDDASVAALAAASFDAFGRVDLLVNNAGVFQGGLCWERSADDWDWVLGVNALGIAHAPRRRSRR